MSSTQTEKPPTRWSRRRWLWAGAGGAVAAGAYAMSQSRGQPPVRKVKVVAEYPHDDGAFTQGLAWHKDGTLYEGTGQYGESTLRRVDLKTGKVQAYHRLDRRVFGEGIALVNDRIFQVTWREGVGYVYERGDLRQVGSFTYPGEGWGLTCDGKRLILSDGSDTLRFFDTDAFRPLGQVRVAQPDGRAVRNLNELEFIDGEVYANVWKSDYIARIDPGNGRVLGWLDLRGLLKARRMGVEDRVLNGIAWDAAGKRLLVTGKNWPRLYHVEVA